MTKLRAAALVLAVGFTMIAIVCIIFWTVHTTPPTGIQGLVVGTAVVSWLWLIATWVRESILTAIKTHRDELSAHIKDAHGSLLAAVGEIQLCDEEHGVNIAEQRQGEAMLMAIRSARRDRRGAFSGLRPSPVDRHQNARISPASHPMTSPPDA